jgi:NADH dehydrogenase
MERMLDADRWDAALENTDVVLNCVGILRPRWRETYEAVHHAAVAALGRAVEQRGLRLVHVSALGLHGGARSRFIRSKWLGEQALLATRANATIVRPSLLDGSDGFGARWLRRVALWPVHLVPSGVCARMAPLSVDDLAQALCVLCERADAEFPDIVELGGPKETLNKHRA